MSSHLMIDCTRDDRGERTNILHLTGTVRIPESHVKTRSHSITAEIENPFGSAEGLICAIGGVISGWHQKQIVDLLPQLCIQPLLCELNLNLAIIATGLSFTIVGVMNVVVLSTPKQQSGISSGTTMLEIVDPSYRGNQK
jgi:hypothetical protein